MQEFMLLPIGAKTFKEAMRMGSEVYHDLKTLYEDIAFAADHFEEIVAF